MMALRLIDWSLYDTSTPDWSVYMMPFKPQKIFSRPHEPTAELWATLVLTGPGGPDGQFSNEVESVKMSRELVLPRVVQRG